MGQQAITTPDVILKAILGRIRAAITTANQSNSWLSALGKAPDLPTSGGDTFHYEVALAGWQFDGGQLIGGGREYMHTIATFDVSVFSTMQQGTPGRDDEFLTDADRGILPIAGLIYRALVIQNSKDGSPLVDENGASLLAEGLRPEAGGLGERTAERGVMTLTFQGRFNWDIGETFASAGA